MLPCRHIASTDVGRAEPRYRMGFETVKAMQSLKVHEKAMCAGTSQRLMDDMDIGNYDWGLMGVMPMEPSAVVTF